MKKQHKKTTPDARQVSPVENEGKRAHEKPLKVYGTLDDVLRAAVKEKPTAAK